MSILMSYMLILFVLNVHFYDKDEPRSLPGLDPRIYKWFVFLNVYITATVVAYDICEFFLFWDPVEFLIFTVIPKSVDHLFIMTTLIVVFFIVCLGISYLCELDLISGDKEKEAHYPHPGITLNIAGAIIVLFYITSISTQWWIPIPDNTTYFTEQLTGVKGAFPSIDDRGSHKISALLEYLFTKVNQNLDISYPKDDSFWKTYGNKLTHLGLWDALLAGFQHSDITLTNSDTFAYKRAVGFYEFFTDGLTFWLFWLTFSVLYVSHLTTLTLNEKTRADQFLLITVVQFLVLFCFSTMDILHFFLAFEATLVPLFYLVGNHGSRSERIRAAFFLFIFTLVGSVFLWYAVLYSAVVLGHTKVTDLAAVLDLADAGTRQVLWWCLFLGFAFKVPLVPFHLWLTVAHVEAPTVGSILLAGLILKLGGYGMLRFVLLVFPALSDSYASAVLTICCIGYTFATLSAIRQLDVKRFIAYTSIAHMNFGLAVLFTVKEIGFMAFCHTMISHGVIASGLFFLIGFIYSQTGVRDSLYLRSLASVVPFFALFWFIFSMANVGMPLLSGFPGEFYGFIALTMTNRFIMLAFAVGFYFTAVYTFLNVSRILFGAPSTKLSHKSLVDLGVIELQVVAYLALWSLILGVVPDIVFNTISCEQKIWKPAVIVARAHMYIDPWTSSVVQETRTEYITKLRKEFGPKDVYFGFVPVDPNAPIGQLLGEQTPNPSKKWLSFAETFFNTRGNTITSQLAAEYNIDYRASKVGSYVARSELSRSFYEHKELSYWDLEGGPHPDVAVRVLYNPAAPKSILHVENWVMFPGRLIETMTGRVIHLVDGSTLASNVKAPESLKDVLLRRSVPTLSELSTPSIINNKLVSGPTPDYDKHYVINTVAPVGAETHQEFEKDQNPAMREFFYKRLHKFWQVQKDNVIQLTTPAYVQSGEDCIIVPELPSKAGTIASLKKAGYDSIAINTRAAPSVFSEVYPARVFFKTNAGYINDCEASMHSYQALEARYKELSAFHTHCRHIDLQMPPAKELLINCMGNSKELQGLGFAEFPRKDMDPDGLKITLAEFDPKKHFRSPVDGQFRDIKKITLPEIIAEAKAKSYIHEGKALDVVPLKDGEVQLTSSNPATGVVEPIEQKVVVSKDGKTRIIK